MLSHGMSGADFRACREYLGYTQAEVAANLQEPGKPMGIEVRTIKRWESPASQWEPRDYGWQFMDEELQHHDEEVNRLLDMVDALKERDGALDSVSLVLFHDNDGMGYMRNDNRPSGVHNSVAREVWQFLNDDGVTVNFVWAMNMNPTQSSDAIW